jgi:hypothetical protein
MRACYVSFGRFERQNAVPAPFSETRLNQPKLLHQHEAGLVRRPTIAAYVSGSNVVSVVLVVPHFGIVLVNKKPADLNPMVVEHIGEQI